MNFSNLRVAAKLWLAVGVIITTLLVLVGLVSFRLSKLEAESSAAQSAMVQRVMQSTKWSGLTALNAVRAEASLLSTDPVVAATFKDPTAATSAQITEIQKNIADSALGDADKAQLEKIASSRKLVLDSRARAQQLKKDGKTEEALALLQGEVKSAVTAYLGEQRKFVEMQEQSLRQSESDAQAGRALLFNVVSVGLALLVLCVLAGAYWLIRSIQQPLEQANSAAALIAEGDLSMQLQSARKDEFGDLLRSLSTMSSSLGRMVHQVRESTDSIATASAEIASGNNDLAARTEQTASNLQQTAASMDNLTQTVRQSADNAHQASTLAASASSVAQKGGDVVKQVVVTMEEINASSTKISDIIGVIDGIAFQTNILALNAAVEAARAGEQGRGFAVVASEVRSLAQRSAQAAKEIKGLIGTSVEKVESGARLVAEAGTTMTDIMQSVKRVTDIVGEISAAATEQSSGIGEINRAVVNLDQMTQQNSALVEESAAAASSMREQATQLAAAVSVFKVHGSLHTTPVHRPASSVKKAVAPVARPVAAPAVKHAPVAAVKRTPVAAPARPAASGPVARSLAAPAAKAKPAAAPAGGEGEWESF
ncbi:methyl-accepting chemotaxis protein [Rhodoferax ferrireducens]|uniref:Methyl-accepting chemotaxis protein n=1 Tax=Rhodoferax ferrireducens TaxID=192843 RepID=A0ABU2C5W3_9BURK|nr:methyl-accepting chemotaxis protein [Rhodoferax ferrireducens]MDR7376654.1 methyl-accepting chemotaxis protein [Rhodoferax ferrireducens]